MAGDYIAAQLGIPRSDLCRRLGVFIKPLNKQPNNPRGHAFRSIVGSLLANYGDPGLTIREEVNPYDCFLVSTFICVRRNQELI
jgi:hypothetical protein